ncbi:hypothetical protein HK103_006278 [Boothiomyces macroporosus]|uniref:F-box domain-containing protein n=1 Tax=Boothiomyces macroporosus TaxID=261099 RepID=A0AAD5UEB9_9FUNG|nr:hypothetical protein HK103_006278 [Boothiomyces macroporosus]
MILLLPYDIQLKVFNYLDVIDLPFISLANKYYYDLLSAYRVFGRSNVFLMGNRLDLQLAEDWDNYRPAPTESHLVRDKIKVQLASQLEPLVKGIYKFQDVAIGGELFAKLHKYLPQSVRMELNITCKSKARINWDAVSDSAMEKITYLKLIGQSRNGTNILKHLNRMTNLKDVLVDGVLESHDLKTLWDVIFNVLRNTQATALEILNNPHINQCAQLLASMIPSSNLQDLTVCCCDIEDEFVQTIAKTLPDSKLKILNFQDNETITDIGYTALAEMLPKSKVKTLNLASNTLIVEDVEILSEALQHSQVTELYMSSDYDDVLSPLYENLHNLKIQWLDISIPGTASEESLINSIAQSHLESIDIDIDVDNLDEFLKEATKSKLQEIRFIASVDVQERVDIIATHIKDTPLKKLGIYQGCGVEKTLVDCFSLLSNLTKETPLTELDLSGLIVKREDITLIFLQLPFTNLTLFKIYCPEMTDKELDNLIPAINLSSLKYLLIGGRPKVSGPAVVRFISRLNNRMFRKLIMEGVILTKEEKRSIRKVLGDYPKFTVTFT